MRSAVGKDETAIAAIFLDMIAKDASKSNILALQGKEAESMLTLMHNVSLCTTQLFSYS